MDYNSDELPTTVEYSVAVSRPTRASLLFYLAVFAAFLPLWISPSVPSTDGPSHLFNSYVYLEYGRVPLFKQAFLTHVPPAGNLTGHGLAILLLALGSPWGVAEKLILTLCMAGLAIAFDYALTGVGSASRFAAFLILPFLYNWPLQMGFWSFSLGVPFLLVCIGLCLRHHGRWEPRSLLWLFLTIAAVYFCHPISWAVCGVVVAVMLLVSEWREFWNEGDRKRVFQQFLIPLLLFFPFALPNLLFAARNELVKWDPITSLPKLAWPLYTDSPLHLFVSDARPARAVFVLLLLASVASLWTRYRRRAFAYVDVLLLVAAVLLLMGLFSPARLGEGTYIGVRLLLFGYLVWALWLGSTLSPRSSALAASLAVVVTLWFVAARRPEWRQAEASLQTAVHLGRAVPADSYVCELNFRPMSELLRPLEHAIDLFPAHRFVDVRDYEAERDAFWTRFRPGYNLEESYLAPVSVRDFELALGRFEQRTGHKLNYLLLVNLEKPPETGLRAALPTKWNEFQQVGESTDGVALFRRE